MSAREESGLDALFYFDRIRTNSKKPPPNRDGLLRPLERTRMARRPSSQPTEGELELLNLSWDHGPAPLGTLCAAVRQSRPVATTTVATMLKIMLDKGLVKRTQSAGGFLWSAAVSRQATQQKLLSGLVERAFDGSARLLVARLLADNKLSAADRKEIVAMLKAGPAGKKEGRP